MTFLTRRRALTALLWLGLLALLTESATLTVAAKAPAPAGLRCEYLKNPLGIEATHPRLSWILTSDQRGQKQTAYQVLVASSEALLKRRKGDLWDSGKVASSETVDIPYAGRPLTSGEQCFWQVRVYDGRNKVSAWSAPALWSMGLLSPTNWTAQWIGYDAAYTPTPQQATNNALFNTSGLHWVRFPSGQAQAGMMGHCLLRKRVVLPASQTFTNAVMALYADNLCHASVNGQPMTNAARRWEATAWINVTPWLHTGTNVLALAATNSDTQGQWACVIGRLVVQFASGSVSNIPVDTSWKAAQQESAGWTQTYFDDSAWTSAESISATPWGVTALNDIARVPASYLRKTFVVGQAITRATVYVTALGVYELHLNGRKVGDDVLTPGWSDFSKRVYYQTYDVTGLVQPGANTLGAILGDGWYASVVGLSGRRMIYQGLPRFLTQLVLELADGSTQTVASDASWMANYGPILFGDILIGSSYDARREMPGWDTPKYNDSAWSPVLTGLSSADGGYSNVRAIVTNVTSIVAGLVTNGQLNFVANNPTLGGDPAAGVSKTLLIASQPAGGPVQTNFYAENGIVNLGGTGQKLTIIQALYGYGALFPGSTNLFKVQAAVTEPSRRLEVLPPISVAEPKRGCYTFDLGQNMVGWVRLNISGSVGDRITVRHGEVLNPDGTIYTDNLRGANATDFYIFGTNGTVIFEPRFTYHGFRYVEVRGLTVPPTRNSVTGIVVNSDMPRTGTFACSSPLLNQLYSNIIWGQKGNYLEVPTDCPQRDERVGWTGDTEVFVPTAAYNFDVQSFYRRHLVTLCEDDQNADGSYPYIAPTAPMMGGGTGGTGWGDAGWICPYNMYRSYGDTNIIADHYASMQRFGQHLAAYSTNCVITNRPGDLGDWSGLSGGGASHTVIDTAFYAYYAQAMSEMAAAIGRRADAVTYSTLHSNIVAAFATLFNAGGSFKDGSGQCGYALAFSLNLVPAGLRAQAARQFAGAIAQFNNHPATGFIGTPRLLPALHAAGRDDLAYTLLLQRTYPSWLYQVTLGATTLWENWSAWPPSFNHYAFGGVGEYLYDAVGGINPASPGYRSILIRPVPGAGLTWASTSYHSTRGLISTAWTNTGKLFKLDVVIPPNTTATVFVPAKDAAGVTESGRPTRKVQGMKFLRMEKNNSVYAVGSGTYRFQSMLPETSN